MLKPAITLACFLGVVRAPKRVSAASARSAGLTCKAFRGGCGALILGGILSPAGAQQPSAATPPNAGPGVITEGAKGVSIGGAPAARVGDRTSEGNPVAKGSSNVFINGKPAVTVGDTTGCGGVVVGGATGVFINGKPVARAGDVTTGCPDTK